MLGSALGIAALIAAAPVPPVHLHANQLCAGSPLVIGSPIGDRSIRDIRVLADASGRRVGWIYATGARSYVQAHARMSEADQDALHLKAAAAVSALRVRPAALPGDLTVRPCRRAEVATY